MCGKRLGRPRRVVRIYADYELRAMIYRVHTCSAACSAAYRARFADTHYHVTETVDEP